MSVDQPSAPNQPEVLQRHRALDVRPEAQGATTRVVAIALTGLLLGPACSSTLPTPEAGAAAAVQREQQARDSLTRDGLLRADAPPLEQYPGGATSLLDEDCDPDDDETDLECRYLAVTDDDGTILGVGAVALAAAKARKAARKATTTRKCRTVKVNGRTRTRC